MSISSKFEGKLQEPMKPEVKGNEENKWQNKHTQQEVNGGNTSKGR